MREPPRPLGVEGRRLWSEWAERVEEEADLVAACELADERTALRMQVFRDGASSDRAALRALDERLDHAMDGLRRSESWGQFARRRSGWWGA